MQKAPSPAPLKVRAALINPMSQRDRIAFHLRCHGSITSVEAEAIYRCRRLASRIDELRKAGMKIISATRHDPTGQRYVRYVLKED